MYNAAGTYSFYHCITANQYWCMPYPIGQDIKYSWVSNWASESRHNTNRWPFFFRCHSGCRKGEARWICSAGWHWKGHHKTSHQPPYLDHLMQVTTWKMTVTRTCVFVYQPKNVPYLLLSVIFCMSLSIADHVFNLIFAQSSRWLDDNCKYHNNSWQVPQCIISVIYRSRTRYML